MPECGACGDDFAPGELYMHHTSYEPEETMAVCRSCHMRIHAKDPYGDEYLPDSSGYDFRGRVRSRSQNKLGMRFPAVAEQVERIVADDEDASGSKAWEGAINTALREMDDRLSE